MLLALKPARRAGRGWGGDKVISGIIFPASAQSRELWRECGAIGAADFRACVLLRRDSENYPQAGNERAPRSASHASEGLWKCWAHKPLRLMHYFDIKNSRPVFDGVVSRDSGVLTHKLRFGWGRRVFAADSCLNWGDRRPILTHFGPIYPVIQP